VIQHRAVVTCKDNQRVFQQSFFLKSLQESSHTMVGFHDNITPRPHSRSTHKTWVWCAGHMGLLHGVVKKERTRFMFLYERLCFGQKGICHVFIYPFCFFAALHITDTRNTVYDTLIVPVVPLHPQQFWIVQACRLAFEIMLVAYLNR